METPNIFLLFLGLMISVIFLIMSHINKGKYSSHILTLFVGILAIRAGYILLSAETMLLIWKVTFIIAPILIAIEVYKIFQSNSK